eukprot:2714700-Karenia_brevis.AAC.1
MPVLEPKQDMIHLLMKWCVNKFGGPSQLLRKMVCNRDGAAGAFAEWLEASFPRSPFVNYFENTGTTDIDTTPVHIGHPKDFGLDINA